MKVLSIVRSPYTSLFFNVVYALSNGIVDGYKKIEQGVVGGYTKLEDKFVDAYLIKDGETVEEAKIRLKEKK